MIEEEWVGVERQTEQITHTYIYIWTHCMNKNKGMFIVALLWNIWLERNIHIFLVIIYLTCVHISSYLQLCYIMDRTRTHQRSIELEGNNHINNFVILAWRYTARRHPWHWRRPSSQEIFLPPTRPDWSTGGRKRDVINE